ncbi:MAG TPA: hypothetical protein VLF59_05025 [Candidatus Saccharimonadales bacterium]|nr:hypothetical protein [Candidatus Saccharimonadales bacterium]
MAARTYSNGYDALAPTVRGSAYELPRSGSAGVLTAQNPGGEVGSAQAGGRTGVALPEARGEDQPGQGHHEEPGAGRRDLRERVAESTEEHPVAGGGGAGRGPNDPPHTTGGGENAAEGDPEEPGEGASGGDRQPDPQEERDPDSTRDIVEVRDTEGPCHLTPVTRAIERPRGVASVPQGPRHARDSAAERAPAEDPGSRERPDQQRGLPTSERTAVELPRHAVPPEPQSASVAEETDKPAADVPVAPREVQVVEVHTGGEPVTTLTGPVDLQSAARKALEAEARERFPMESREDIPPMIRELLDRHIAETRSRWVNLRIATNALRERYGDAVDPTEVANIRSLPVHPRESGGEVPAVPTTEVPRGAGEQTTQIPLTAPAKTADPKDYTHGQDKASAVQTAQAEAAAWRGATGVPLPGTVERGGAEVDRRIGTEPTVDLRQLAPEVREVTAIPPRRNLSETEAAVGTAAVTGAAQLGEPADSTVEQAPQVDPVQAERDILARAAAAEWRARMDASRARGPLPGEALPPQIMAHPSGLPGRVPGSTVPRNEREGAIDVGEGGEATADEQRRVARALLQQMTGYAETEEFDADDEGDRGYPQDAPEETGDGQTE